MKRRAGCYMHLFGVEMKNPTFLQILGLATAPIPPLVGADLGKELAREDPKTTLIRVDTDIRPLTFKIPCQYTEADGILMCDADDFTFEAFEELEIQSIWAKAPKKFVEMYKELGVVKKWIKLDTYPVHAYPGDKITITWSSRGLWRFGDL